MVHFTEPRDELSAQCRTDRSAGSNANATDVVEMQTMLDEYSNLIPSRGDATHDNVCRKIAIIGFTGFLGPTSWLLCWQRLRMSA